MAELRLLLKDCAGIRRTARTGAGNPVRPSRGRRVLILRILTQTSCAVEQEDFLSASELAGFVDRLIAGVERARRGSRPSNPPPTSHGSRTSWPT